MRKPTPILYSVAVLLIVSLACGLPANLPGVPPTVATLDPNAAGTAIILTMESALTQTAGAVVVPIGVIASPTPTLTPEPTLTLSPTATLSPAPIFTDTPVIPLITVSVATNCRLGPGQVYDQVGALLVGEVAEVIARDPTDRYWYIKNPDISNGFCWLWGKYATVAGNVSALPLYTPPPTPTPMPSFEVAYERMDTCVGRWVEFELTNTGAIPFESISLSLRDLDAEKDLAMYSDQFTDLDGCTKSYTAEVLRVGASLVISTPAFAHNPSGHKMRATITLCSADGQKGLCVTEVVKFTP